MATGQYIGVNGVARKVTTPYVGVEGIARKVTNGYVGVDGVARLFFAPEDGEAVVLEVEKITSDTYANETTYTAEEFILLDIYPKTGGTVNVTYGGLTKTITDTSGVAEPNAQQVFFGTFNGVSDSVATPTSGELTIEGDYYAFGCGAYAKDSKNAIPPVCSCVTNIVSFGKTSSIPSFAFGTHGAESCTKLETVTIPGSITNIGSNAFAMCTGLEEVVIDEGLLAIGSSAFQGCAALKNIVIPFTVQNIDGNIFYNVDRFSNLVTLDSKNSHYKVDGKSIVEIATNTLVIGFNDSVIPSYITSIARNAYQSCVSMTEITIPASVTSMGSSVFYGCAKLEKVNVLATSPPVIENPIFGLFNSNSDNLVVVVPKGCGDAYKAAEGWREDADIIVEAS